ncbi:MAG: hypothetical protein MJZ37_00820 [Bacilli bacterium]|nr:hypothetical protein [Bacilli bacterium]
MINILSQEIIEKNKLIDVGYCYSWDDSGSMHYQCLDGYPAYSKEFAEYGYEECLKDYPDNCWFIAERDGVYWCANGCNENHGVAAGWKIIKKNY